MKRMNVARYARHYVIFAQ